MSIDNNNEEHQRVVAWLKAFWGDESFEVPFAHFNLPAFAGTYTLLNCLVTRNDEEYFFKRYHPKINRARGGVTEFRNYCERGYERHPVFPRLIASLPGSIEGIASNPPEAILISYYPYDLLSPSTLEIMACILSLATLFIYFKRDGRIYFDLKPQSLRLDRQGGLHLIDYTDLMTPKELCDYKIGIPHTDPHYCPPEGLAYQQASSDYWGGGSFRRTYLAANALDPDSYHSFNLGNLSYDLLSLTEPGSNRSGTQTSTCNQMSGDLIHEQQVAFHEMLRRTQEPASEDRISLEEIRVTIWQLIKDRLVETKGPSAPVALRSRRLLRTLTIDPMDTLSLEIGAKLEGFWRSEI